ncbi:uncharacterized protein [Dysidea avara]|uniref:uncharacterized protein isoform X2 n=1 Tax=Dysidea avara TaxID=196820 RepID=UPI0033234029
MNRKNVSYRLMMGGNCSDVLTTKAIEECTEDFTKRADKNDSGSLSLKEFQEFFSDGIMTSEELEELFHLIDNEKNQQYMADFEPIFSLTDDLSVAIANILKSTHNKHQSTYEEQNHIPYPSWTRFVGSLLVISTTLPIPLIFIIRLIWKKEERKIAIDWFVNFPTRCRGAWNNFKQFWSNVELENPFRAVYDRCCRHGSWTPIQPQSVDMQINSDNDDDGKDL